MVRLCLLLIGLVCISSSHAQPITYNKYTTQITYSRVAFNSGSNQVVAFWNLLGYSMGLATIDSLGNLKKIDAYGTDSSEILETAVNNTKGEFMLMGSTFLFQNSRNYVVITDSFGNYKRAFHFTKPNNLISKVNNGFYLNNHYYFWGLNSDTTISNPSHKEIYIAKTDTFGNLLWIRSDFIQSSSDDYYWHNAFEPSLDGKHLLLGTTYKDSISNNTDFYSYLLLEFDTSGNFTKRVPLPDLDSLVALANTITSIKKIDNRYFVSGIRDLFMLDSNLNVLDRQYPPYLTIGTNRTLSISLDNAIVLSGAFGFAKLHNGDSVFTRLFKDEVDFISFINIVPTYDGGYFAILHSSGGTRYIKMDCDGNYLNPSWACWPGSTPEVVFHQQELSISYQYSSWELMPLGINPIQEVQVYNSMGQLVCRGLPSDNKSSVIVSHSNFAVGVYYLKVRFLKGTKNLKVIKT